MWLSLAVFVIASLTDYIDGQIARKHNQVSDFGKLFDPFADVFDENGNANPLTMISQEEFAALTDFDEENSYDLEDEESDE